MPTPPPLAPGALPLAGHAPSFFKDPVALIDAGRRAHGPVFSVRLGPDRAAVVTGPHESRQVLALPESTLAVRPVYQWLRPMFGDVMQAAAHRDYLAQRAALLPAFRGRHVEDRTAPVARDIHAWVASLGTSGRFDANPAMQRLTLDIAVRLVLGEDFRARHGAEFRRLFLDVAAGMEFLLPENFPLPRLVRRNRARRRLFTMLLPELRAARAGQDPARRGYLATIAAAHDGDGAPFDEDTAVGLALILCYASYETTAAQLAWALVLLLQHPRQLAPVAEEVRAVLPAGEDPVPVGALRKLELLGRCLWEVQRLRPVTTVLTRSVEETYEVGGHSVPSGWKTLLCPPVTHRDPELYPDPGTFDPDRFSSARDPEGRAVAGLLNFSGGGHACLGRHLADLEMRLVLALLLRRYEMRLVDPHPAPERRVGPSRPAGACPIAYRAPAGARHR
ncbi:MULTISPECIES: cytochrome P450 [Streptomyces]|uniref:Cytochrome P450 n=1 Tax=Streptomyces luteosporeus TaxID=173856 RepID=A0ABP6G7S3_9ACTN